MSAITRRNALTAGAAALATGTAANVAAITIAKAAPDPIYAAIEAYRKTDAAFIARCIFEDDLAEKGIKFERDDNDGRTPEMIAIVNASIAARASLANTAPTTPAGLVAYLDYVLAESLDDFLFDGDDETIDFVRSLARSAAVQS
jgi:hypothetical protein